MPAFTITGIKHVGSWKVMTRTKRNDKMVLRESKSGCWLGGVAVLPEYA
jgi:hypothetical protein